MTKNLFLVGFASMGLFAALAACGDEGGGSGGSGGTSSSVSTATSGGENAGGGGNGGGNGGNGGNGGGMLINGCTQAAAEDHLADANVKVTFGVNGSVYTPACIRIKKGASVTFEGMFSTHPLVGGTAALPPVPDSSSPIQATSAGTAATFTFDSTGTFPYYCEYHQPSMAGAVFVE